jgi:hypothetical protein
MRRMPLASPHGGQYAIVEKRELRFDDRVDGPTSPHEGPLLHSAAWRSNPLRRVAARSETKKARIQARLPNSISQTPSAISLGHSCGRIRSVRGFTHWSRTVASAQDFFLRIRDQTGIADRPTASSAIQSRKLPAPYRAVQLHETPPHQPVGCGQDCVDRLRSILASTLEEFRDVRQQAPRIRWTLRSLNVASAALLLSRRHRIPVALNQF